MVLNPIAVIGSHSSNRPFGDGFFLCVLALPALPDYNSWSAALNLKLREMFSLLEFFKAVATFLKFSSVKYSPKLTLGTEQKVKG